LTNSCQFLRILEKVLEEFSTKFWEGKKSEPFKNSGEFFTIIKNSADFLIIIKYS
jgi:hypothetical protein